LSGGIEQDTKVNVINKVKTENKIYKQFKK
jgi:hypothetical protein